MDNEKKKPTRPQYLGTQGKRLWDDLTSDIDFRPDELSILGDACRETDLIERLEKELRKADLVVKGSQGQPVANPLVQEIRQHRATKATLLRKLDIPEDDAGDAAGNRSAHGRALANARWKMAG